ncbi:MAG: aldehyde dehydrogenase family protein [Bdellovibrionales bacterium]|nr:aldehyde dehydrogenase family protein [Bdellovibrionales bacterium]
MSPLQFPTQQIELGNFIGGEWIQTSGKKRNVLSPYNSQILGSFNECTPSEIDQAIQTSSKAFFHWSQTTLKERCGLLLQWRQILLNNLDSMTCIVAAESGKTPAEAKAGILKGIEVLEFASAIQNLDTGGQMEVSRGVSCAFRREPLGVVAGVTPFNFPAMVPMWMIPLALVAGNCFIWKPSEKTPLTSKWLADGLREAGLPAGVFSVLQGGSSTVENIIDHPEVKALAFVGSSPVAESIYRRGTQLGKRVLALGGAKNHIFLLPDANPQLAAEGIGDSFTGCAGQRCMAASVLIAIGDCDDLIKKIANHVSQKILGKDMGAIINQASLDRLLAAISEAEKLGGRLLLDGRKNTPPKGFEKGFWLGPTIIDHAPRHSQAACEEIFGPVLAIVHATNLSEAIAIENSSKYGNAASVFTQNGPLANRVAHETKAGMIGINVGVPVPREPFSFGGVGASKYGHGDITGMSGLDFWTNLRKITTKWQSQPDQNWMS